MLKNIQACLLILCSIPTVPGRLDATVAQEAASEEKLVDVGGYRLQFRVIAGQRVTGSVLPVIVLEAGGGADSSEWSSLQPKLAEETGCTVVAYDRAGFGNSDIAIGGYDVVNELGALRIGLEKLGLAERVLLVGHSYGGVLNQLYAHMFPDTVVGVVLIDSNSVEFARVIGGPRELMDIPFPTKPPLTKSAQAGIGQIMAFNRTIETLDQAPLPQSVPAVIIAAGKPWWTKKTWNDGYRIAQQHLAEAAPNRRFVLAKDADHNIPGERPDLIVSAVQSLLRSPAAKP